MVKASQLNRMAQPLINISKKQALIFAVFLVMYEFLTYVANDMIMPGMIKVVESLQGPESAIATSLTFYILGGASLQLFLGPLSDRYGRRPIMLSGALLFFICTVAITLSASINQFLTARFFQGMGLCFISVVGYATMQEIFEEMDAVRLIAIMANVSILAPLTGPLLGAMVIYYFNWRVIFVIIGAFSLLALWGLWQYMPESVGQTKRDGSYIKRIPLSMPIIFSNYKKLLTNRGFMMGSIAMGLLAMPCLAWIALSPIILIGDAGMSLFQYGLWQIPLFGASIVGNGVLQIMTRHGTLEKIILTGSVVATLSLLMVFILPASMNNNYIWLIPGLAGYFFGFGITGAPLSRFILFSTSVGKGTASALMSMIIMCIQAVGIETANFLYRSHDNMIFGLYCAIAGLFFLLVICGALVSRQTVKK